MQGINLEIKEEFKSTIVGFNGSGLPLGERNDLHLLAEMAQYDKYLASFFVELPTSEQLTEYKQELFLQTHPAVIPVPDEIKETNPETEEPTENLEEH